MLGFAPLASVPISSPGWEWLPATSGYTLTASQGTYTLTGQAASLALSRILSAVSGTYALTGQDAALTRTLVLAAAQGSLAVTGQGANLLTSRVLTAAQGSYAVTGQDATLTADTSTFPVGWKRQCALSISSSVIGGTGTHTGFPVRLTESNLPSEMLDPSDEYAALSDGRDIRFSSDADGLNPLPCHVVYWRPAAANPRAVIYVNVDLDGTNGNTIYIWYSNPNATQLASTHSYGSQAVWATGYQAAWVDIFNNGVFVDATGNGYDIDATLLAGFSRVTFAEYTSTDTSVPAVHQGVIWGGDAWYAIDTNALYKYTTLSGTATHSNTDPCGDVDVACNHCGAGFVSGDYLYIPVEYWSSCGSFSDQYIALFSKTDLSYVTSFDVSAQGHEVSAACVDPNAGTNGVIYVTSYCDATKLWKYDLLNGSYLGSITLQAAALAYFQGITIYNGCFVISCYTSTTPVSRVSAWTQAGTYLGAVINSYTSAPTAGESITEKDGDLYWWDGDPGNEAMFLLSGFKNSGILIEGTDYTSLRATLTHGDNGTISAIAKPVSFYNYNSLWDNSVDANDWEGWLDSTYKFRARIDNPAVDYQMVAGDASAFHQFAFAWTKSGASAATKNVTDGVSRDTDTDTWVTPGSYFYINGHTGNTPGGARFKKLTISSVNRDNNWLLTEYNNELSGVSFTTAGTPAFFGYLLEAGYGSLALTGQDAALLEALILIAAQGSFALTGQDASLLASRLLASAQGSYVLSGQDALLSRAFILAAASGSYTVTGQDAALLASRLLTGSQGSYALSGADALLSKRFTLSLASGSLALSGQDAALIVSRVLSGAYGVYSVTGPAVELSYSGIHTAFVATVHLAMQDPTKTFVIEVADRTILATQNDTTLLLN